MGYKHFRVWGPRDETTEAMVFMGFTATELAVLRKQIDAKNESTMLSIAADLQRENYRLFRENAELAAKLAILEAAALK